jgi:hypothetical protein
MPCKRKLTEGQCTYSRAPCTATAQYVHTYTLYLWPYQISKPPPWLSTMGRSGRIYTPLNQSIPTGIPAHYLLYDTNHSLCSPSTCPLGMEAAAAATMATPRSPVGSGGLAIDALVCWCYLTSVVQDPPVSAVLSPGGFKPPAIPPLAWR